MTQPRLPYGRQEITAEDVAEVIACLQSERITQGPRVRTFEAGLEERTGAPHAVAVSSGTAALHLAYQALGVGPGDVVVTSPITFVATANAARYLGAQVAFADVDPRTGLIALDSLRALVERLAAAGTPPKLIVPVDMAGQPADLPAIQELADAHGAEVVSDAAHSLGASYAWEGEEVAAGSCRHSAAAILSFHPVKPITTAEGGAVLTRDEAVCRRLLELRSHGVHKDPARLQRPADDPWVGPWYYEQDQLGLNYRITDLQCALGSSQLGRLAVFVARRRELAARYDAALGRPDLATRVRPLVQHSGRRSAYHLYVVQVVPVAGEDGAGVAARRKDLFAHLERAGIDPQVHYVPVHWQPFHAGAAADELPGAAAYYAGCLSLPLYPSLSDSEQERVIAALRDWRG